MTQRANTFRVAAGYQPVMRRVGLDAENVFTHPGIVVWRKLPDRENCTLDAEAAGGDGIRLHIKRYQASRGKRTPADEEVKGYEALAAKEIPTAPLVGWGGLVDGRSFVIFEDLKGYTPADKLIGSGAGFDQLLKPTADLAAKLHNAGLHHRDLYLCHFMARPQRDGTDLQLADLKLIDTARVRVLPGVFTRNRWIVKDLAQFWYSTLALGVTDVQRDQWLQRYAEARKLPGGEGLKRPIQRKVRGIARHDRKLRRAQPTRNISISH